MKRLLAQWRQLKPEAHDYIGVYAWGALWMAWFLVFTPAPISGLIFRGTIILVGAAGIVGAIIAIYGVFQADRLITEKYGVLVLMLAPLSYTVIQLAQTIVDLVTLGETQRSHLILLGLWPFWFLMKRFRYLSRQVGEAKVTPLPHEAA